LILLKLIFCSDIKSEYDATGKATYYAICKRLNTTPVSYFIKHMAETQINLQYHGIGVKGAKALAGALVVNIFDERIVKLIFLLT